MSAQREIIICPACHMEFRARDVAGMDACPVCGRPFGEDPPPGWVDSQDGMAFVNPANGHVERINDAWAWVLVFGCFYFAVKGVWSHALIGLILALMTGGLSWLVYPFFAARIMRTFYLRKGWRPA